MRPLTPHAHVLWNWQIWFVLLTGLVLFASLLVYLNVRQTADATLRQAEEHYRGLFDSAPAMYVITRPENGMPMITDCNELFLRTLGYAREEVIGRFLMEFHSPNSRNELLNSYRRSLDGVRVEGERELLTRSGTTVPVMLRG